MALVIYLLSIYRFDSNGDKNDDDEDGYWWFIFINRLTRWRLG